ncbi:MAG TPA: hypothetical protein VGQ89_12540 [Candidatus Limnocylindrales bacterium]|jgi:hypothetical protein|nr:hypothetical protein [Candidatus Limnocylindrales bacterium]
MSRRTFVVTVAWLAAVAGAMLVFVARTGSSFADDSFTPVLGGLALAIATNASVGAILTLRRPGNIVGFVLMLAAVLSAVTLLGWISGAAMTEQRGRDDFLAGLLSLIGAVGFIPSVIVGGPLLALLFPTGRLPDRIWRWPVGAMFAALAVALAAGVVHPGQIVGSLATNPFGASAFSGSEAFWTVGLTVAYAILPFSLVLALAAVIVRARRSQGVERAQLKWFVAANVSVGTLLTLGFADGGLGVGLYAGVNPTIFDFLAVASLSLPATAVGVAILRYRLYDIDRIISRSLSYGVLTGVLGAVFAATAIGLSALLGSMAQGESLAVAASTLLVLALFGPLRKRAQSVVDRRFDRFHYDAARTVQALTERLRDDVDLERVEADVLRVVDRTFHPSHAGLWLRGASR